MRRSILMNITTSCYRLTRVLRAKDLFQKIADLAREAQIKSKTAQKMQVTKTTTEESQDSRQVDLPTFDDDKVLYEVSYDNDFDLSQSLRAIASFNRRNREVIHVFYEPFLQKLKTVLQLQNWIKGVLFRRR